MNISSNCAYRNGEYAFDFDKRSKDSLVEFMKNPVEPSAPVAEDMWAGVPGVEHVHQLTTKTFNQFITTNPSVLVMFYAPCKYLTYLFYTTCDENVILRFGSCSIVVQHGQVTPHLKALDEQISNMLLVSN